jgi:hypothetical protein
MTATAYPNPQGQPFPRAAAPARGGLLPRTSAAPGQVLWGEAPRRQPIVPLIALAILTVLVAAPAAMSSTGQSSNPMTLLHQSAGYLYQITTEMDQANTQLSEINDNAVPLRVLNANMMGIAVEAKGISDKTDQLNTSLTDVGTSVAGSDSALGNVSTKLADTSKTIGSLKSALGGSLGSTKGIIADFTTINTSIGTMNKGLGTTIGLMAQSTPLTKAFATNKTRLTITGGDPTKFGVPNVLPGTSVMSVVLPMLNQLQKGGMLAARKDSATASNPLVGSILNKQIPDGANLVVTARPFDGFYGVPPSSYFVDHMVNGF